MAGRQLNECLLGNKILYRFIGSPDSAPDMFQILFPLHWRLIHFGQWLSVVPCPFGQHIKNYASIPLLLRVAYKSVRQMDSWENNNEE
jgi:hypothetical protein